MDLNFDIRALVEPKTNEDVVAAINEALDELEIINKILDNLLKD